MFDELKDIRVSIYTLGCKVNIYESESMEDSLIGCGCQIVSFEDKADVYIINTCAVTNMAERKSRQIIKRAKRLNPDAIMVATGCYVQANKEAIASNESVDFFIGNNKKGKIAELLSEYIRTNQVQDNFIDINHTEEYDDLHLLRSREHTRAYVKVQDGCNAFCTFCIIPYTRGRIRSRSVQDVVSEVEGLAVTGVKEVVITGINLPSYVSNKGEGLLELLNSVSEIEGIVRIRLGSLEPRVITDEFLKGISSNPKICPHFHLSLQSACDKTLRQMNRRYSIDEYMSKCSLIRQYYDRPAITTDVIVGFPNETDEDFEITYNNLKHINFYEMHVFKYSKRYGTPAAKLEEQVSDESKEIRSNRLLEMTAYQKAEYEKSFEGEDLEVLVEEYVMENGRYYIKGHTERYIMVKKEFDEHTCRRSVNEIITVRY